MKKEKQELMIDLFLNISLVTKKIFTNKK